MCVQEQDEAKRRQLMRLRVAELRLQTVDEINQVANETVRIIETATVPILGVDRNGQIIGWNGQIAKITGAWCAQRTAGTSGLVPTTGGVLWWAARCPFGGCLGAVAAAGSGGGGKCGHHQEAAPLGEEPQAEMSGFGVQGLGFRVGD